MKCFCTTIIDLNFSHINFRPPPSPKPHEPQAGAPVVAMALVVGKIP